MLKLNTFQMNNKIIICLAIMVLLLGSVSALELNPFATTKDYKTVITEDMSDFIKEDFNEDYGVIRLDKNTFWLWEDRIAEYSLISNTEQCLIDCEAIGKVTLYQNEKLFDEMNFYDGGSNKVNLDYKIYVEETEEYDVEVPDKYKKVCEEVKINATEETKTECWEEIDTYKTETRERKSWVEYNFEELEAGDYKWKLTGSKDATQKVDWIGNINNKEFDEWAWWDSDWGKKKEVSNLTSNISIFYIDYDSDMNSDFSDIRFTDDGELAELNYSLDYIDNSNIALAYVDNLGEDTIYMYYKNDEASDNSNMSDVMKNPISYLSFNNGTYNTTRVTDRISFTDFQITGSSINQGVDGKIGQSFNFTGANSNYITVTKFPVASNYTFLFLVNNPTIEFQERLYDARGSTWNSNCWQFELRGTGVNEFWYNRYGYNQGTGYGNSLNVWQTYVSSFSTSDNVDLFNNGTQVINAMDYPLTETYTQTIGSYSDTSYNLKLYVDEFAFWDRRLSEDDVAYVSSMNAPDVVFGSEESLASVDIELNSPEDSLLTTNSEITFNVTLTPVNINVTNATLYVGDIENFTTYNTNEITELIDVIVLSDGEYSWNVTAGGSNGQEYYSTTRTFEIDSTAPDITITSPASTISYGYENITHYLNWSITDTNLDSIWWEYDATNTTIYGADNSTTFNLSDYDARTITIYANDTAGNIASESISWDYDLFKNSETYTSPVYSTQQNDFIVNFTFDNSKYNSIYGNLIYDGTSYAGTASGTGNNYVFTKSLYAADVDAATNYPFYWNMQLVNGSGSTYQNTTTINQTVNPLTDIIVSSAPCAAGLNTSLIFNFYDEENLNSTVVNVDYNFHFGLSQEYSNYNYGNNASTNVLYICINTTDIDSYYLNYGELDYQGTGFTERRYYTFTNRTLTANPTNMSVYSLLSGSSTSFSMEVVDTKLSPYENVYLTLSRWYPSLNEYRVVEMAQTDEKGETVFKTKVEDVDYRIGVYYPNGTLIHITDPLRFVCLESPCSYTITVPSTSSEDFEVFNDLSYSLTFNSTSKVFRFVFSDPSQTTESFSLVAYKQSGSAELIVCNESVSGWTGVITCDVSAYSGTIIAYAYRSASPLTTIASLVETIRNTELTQDIGLFISVFVVIALSLIGLVSPVLTVLLSVVGLIPAMIFGIMPLGIIFVLMAMGFIVIHFMKKSRSAG